jgi:hypothetical protein
MDWLVESRQTWAKFRLYLSLSVQPEILKGRDRRERFKYTRERVSILNYGQMFLPISLYLNHFLPYYEGPHSKQRPDVNLSRSTEAVCTFPATSNSTRLLSSTPLLASDLNLRDRFSSVVCFACLLTICWSAMLWSSFRQLFK